MGIDTTNPEHYKAGKLEAWDVLDEFFPNDPLLWNAGKYLMRLGKKDAPAQEIGKIKTYLDRWLEKKGEELLETNQNTWTDAPTELKLTYWHKLPDDMHERLLLLQRDGAITRAESARNSPDKAPFLVIGTVGVVLPHTLGHYVSDSFRSFEDRWAKYVEDNNL